MAKPVAAKASTVTLTLAPNPHADEVKLDAVATLTTRSRLTVKESIWTAAQSWLAQRPVAEYITVEE